ncbi:unnamed protein product [Sphagnum jensenii]|uniref:Protein RETICULATA-RELATED 4, chloroplastic-like n=1 Tax=Sphagnum jensenii TaxID=128206 RepID=A0ABP0WAB6_9BRYO
MAALGIAFTPGVCVSRRSSWGAVGLPVLDKRVWAFGGAVCGDSRVCLVSGGGNHQYQQERWGGESPSSTLAVSSFLEPGVILVQQRWSNRRNCSGSRIRAAATELVGEGGGDGGNTGVGGGDGNGGSWGGEGGGGGGAEGGGGDEQEGNRTESLLVLSTLGRSLESLPADLASAIKDGRITPEIIRRFAELEKSPVFRWLLNFGGFKERLLADDLFLTKVGIECGVGIFTKTAAELERRRENFSKELDFVIADVVMALIADFMLVWLPAPTVSLRPRLALNAGVISKFFYNCPDNAFQVAIRGTSYTTLQRFGAIVRNGVKLLAVGTSASLVGTASTNALTKLRSKFDKNFEGKSEDVPILATSLAYGVYMSVSSNLRYQVVAGVLEQRLLEPMLHNQKLLLSALCFAVRTGNTFLGSLLWVDYARWVGVQ